MKTADHRAVAQRYLEALPTDFDGLRSLQHPEFVQEFPQSRELIRGAANFRAAHENYPQGEPEDSLTSVIGSEDRSTVSPSFTLIRLVGGGDTFTGESKARYPDGSEYHAITILEIKDAKVSELEPISPRHSRRLPGVQHG